MAVNGNCDAGYKIGFQVCIIGEDLKNNEQLMNAVNHFKLPVVYSLTGQEYVSTGADYRTVFVLPEFEGEVYDSLKKSGQRILGPTAMMQFFNKNEPLPSNVKPLYTVSMRNLVICFTGFRVREELARFVHLIHHMGGCVRREFDVSKVTHLVANTTSGEKYRYAANYGIPIMRAEWINQLWSKRDDPNCLATDDDMINLKLLPFVGCKMVFAGFQDDEKKHMHEIAMQNGGEIMASADTTCSHVVVEDNFTSLSEVLPDQETKLFVVKAEWFWASIQMEARADEQIYAFVPPNTTLLSSSLVLTSVKGSKRKRLESVAHQLAIENAHEHDYFSLTPDLARKGEVAKLSISGSFLDATLSPDRVTDITAEVSVSESTIKSPLDIQSFTPRQRVCMELFQTETNYVAILHTIITVFKEPVEQPDQAGGPLLNAAEIKIIFGNLPPIYEVHQKLRTELAGIMHSWKENSSIGNLILRHAHDFLKAYPPFVNFFEKTKEVLASCDTAKPRFHAFLKRCQNRPECGRQSLQELLIRPIQRLPSMILLLTDVLKHTNKNDPDYQALERAISAVKEVLTHINEDKRRTEGQVAMFDIINDIENCPPNLLSSHRHFITKVDMQEIGDILSRKGDTITMFLFTDMLEICKRRRAISTLKSPSVASLASGTLKAQPKCYKHLELMQLSHIKRVVDITETEECKHVFSIVVRSNQEIKERLLTFILLGEDVNKSLFLRTLCRHIANTVYRADAENLLTTLDPEQLALNLGENNGSAFTKALKIATKTREKLGRALSMRRTPTKRELSRAVSTFISPLRNSGTPTNTLRGLRLASVSNLTDLDNASRNIHPSPVGGKKMKASSLGVSATKYL